VSTVPDLIIELLRSPSTRSFAVAPGSVKLFPISRINVVDPVRVITGAVVSGGVFTTIVLVTELELPSASVTL